MKKAMIGVDLAKSVLQLHGASMTGDLYFHKKLSRARFRKFMADHPPAVVVQCPLWGAQDDPSRA